MASMVVLVREVKTHTAIGLFWGNTLAEIARQVDAKHSPLGCEYTRLRAGGVQFCARAGTIPPATDDHLNRLFNDADLDEINDLATCDGRQTWRRFTRNHLI